MSKREFMASFNKMRVAFQKSVVESESAVYLEYLGNLPYISEVMGQASNGKLGFDNRYLPNVPQLIEAHDNYEKEVDKKNRNENADKFGLIEGKVELSNEQMEANRKTGKKTRYFRYRAERHGYSGLEQMRYIQKRMRWEVTGE